MDELELLKKDWKKTETQYESYSDSEIYPMLHKKSSSIVKTLFYVSVAELIFWIIINSIPYFSSQEYREKLNAIYGDGILMTLLTVVSYGVILFFVYKLFNAHKSISVTDNARRLMKKILHTRKIIKWYVIYNLAMAFVSLSIGLYHALHNDPDITNKLADFNDKQMLVFTLTIVVFVGLFILFIWLFYKLIYGILLRRLNRNYQELKKIEV